MIRCHNSTTKHTLMITRVPVIIHLKRLNVRFKVTLDLINSKRQEMVNVRVAN